jgi:hypothetical protein
MQHSGWETICIRGRKKKAAKDAGLNYIFNEISVTMKESLVSEEEAIGICRKKIDDEMFTFNSSLINTGTCKPSKDTIVYLEAVGYSYIGNSVWNMYFLRYHERI